MKGFSLIEAILAVVITSVVGTLLLVIIVNSAGLFYKESSKVGQGIGVNNALSQISQNIKNSTGVLASYTSGSEAYTSNSTQLVLKIPSVDTNNNIITNTFDYFVFFLDLDKLRFKSFPDTTAPSSRKPADQILSLNVKSLLIQYFNSANPPQEVAPTVATKIRITLTLRQKAGASFETHTATSEASLRND